MEGLLEMKAEEMDNISVEIHTRHGQVIGKFLHGLLKQGSPLSVLVSNCTLTFKHRVYLKSGLSLPSDKPTSLSDKVWNMLIKGTSLKSERSLGIWRDKFGDTSESAEKEHFYLALK